MRSRQVFTVGPNATIGPLLPVFYRSELIFTELIQEI